MKVIILGAGGIGILRSGELRSGVGKRVSPEPIKIGATRSEGVKRARRALEYRIDT